MPVFDPTQRTLRKHIIPPPIHCKCSALGKLQGEKYKKHRNHSPAIQCRTRHIVELDPPRGIALADQVLEHESDEEP